MFQHGGAFVSLVRNTPRGTRVNQQHLSLAEREQQYFMSREDLFIVSSSDDAREVCAKSN